MTTTSEEEPVGQTIAEADSRTAGPHPPYAQLVAWFTPAPLPDRPGPPPATLVRTQRLLAALTAAIAEHHPAVAGRWVVCAGCTRGNPPDDRAVAADVVVPCRTLRAICDAYALPISDADWAEANAAMLRAAGRSDVQVTQAAVLAAARAEDAPIWAAIAERWPTGTEPTDRTETPE